MSHRVVLPELLDHLAADDPEALRSRRDLRRINFLMGNERWICRTLRRFPSEADRGIVEIGAGDGMLCNKLARMFPQARVAAYDLAPPPAKLDARIVWQRGDVFETAPPVAGGILIANLFLHHFEELALKELGCWMAPFEVLVFNEPDRTRMPHFLGRLMWPGINAVTRHDMHVSIDAGFATGEMVRFLGLMEPRWRIRETCIWRGARRVVACRT